MNHFKLVYDGIQAPKARSADTARVQTANQPGYYIVSDGKKHPARVKSALPATTSIRLNPQMIQGMIADAGWGDRRTGTWSRAKGIGKNMP
jgi:NADH:ubiquinone oxidoreductase subunit D